MSDIKRTEWLQPDDVITEDMRNGFLYKVEEVSPEKNGITVSKLNEIEGYRVITFISDADPTEYFKLTNKDV